MATAIGSIVGCATGGVPLTGVLVVVEVASAAFASSRSFWAAARLATKAGPLLFFIAVYNLLFASFFLASQLGPLLLLVASSSLASASKNNCFISGVLNLSNATFSLSFASRYLANQSSPLLVSSSNATRSAFALINS